MIDKFLEVHVTTIAQYSFELGVFSTPSKIFGGAGAPPTPPLLPPMIWSILSVSLSLYYMKHFKLVLLV